MGAFTKRLWFYKYPHIFCANEKNVSLAFHRDSAKWWSAASTIHNDLNSKWLLRCSIFLINTIAFIADHTQSASGKFLLDFHWHSSVNDGEQKWIAVLWSVVQGKRWGWAKGERTINIKEVAGFWGVIKGDRCWNMPGKSILEGTTKLFTWGSWETWSTGNSLKNEDNQQCLFK